MREIYKKLLLSKRKRFNSNLLIFEKNGVECQRTIVKSVEHKKQSEEEWTDYNLQNDLSPTQWPRYLLWLRFSCICSNKSVFPSSFFSIRNFSSPIPPKNERRTEKETSLLQTYEPVHIHVVIVQRIHVVDQVKLCMLSTVHINNPLYFYFPVDKH